jgi:AAA domain
MPMTGTRRPAHLLGQRYATAAAFLAAIDVYWGQNGHVAAADGRTFCAACPACNSKSRPKEESYRRFPLVVGETDEPSRWNLAPMCGCGERAILEALDGQAPRPTSSWEPEDLRPILAALEGQGVDSSGPSGGERRALDGAAFVFGEPEHVPTVWGSGQAVLWSAGEALWLVGPQGVGKTTVQQQLALRRAGVRTGGLLGYPVERDGGRVLYLALDRPRQAARSFRRMVSQDDAATLAERLVVWRGPLPFDLVAEPERLAGFAREHDAGTLFIDAMKDAAMDLVKDEVGARVNHALQHAVADGIEVCAGHHQRKPQSDNRAPRALADVYGSVWLTAGAGSVVLLWGEPGDPVVELRHLKQPAEEVGPTRVVHDHGRGETTPFEAPELLELVAGTPGGVSAPDAARALFEVAKPTAAQTMKARRKLERLVEDGVADRLPAQAPDPVRFAARERR